MNRAPIRLAILALLLTIHAPPARAQSDNPDVGPRETMAPYRPEEAAVPASLQEIYRRLAAYWEAEDPRAIAQLLAPGGRVHVVLQHQGVGERLAAAQLQYLLMEVFESTEEVTFRFPAYSTYDPSTGTGYAVGQRVYRDGRGLQSYVERVFVATRSDRGRWIVTELRLTLD